MGVGRCTVRRPDHTRALISLSPDGGDAHRVREFDLETKAFVDGGFDIPTAKTRLAWIDDDTILVATDTGPDSLTTSSYPRQARLLGRGQAIDTAPIVAEVPRDHVAVFVGSDVGAPNGRTRDRVVAVDAIDFFNSRTSFIELDDLRAADGTLPTTASAWESAWIDIDVPTDVSVGIDDDFVLFRPQSAWDAGDIVVPARRSRRSPHRRGEGRHHPPAADLLPGRPHGAALMVVDPRPPRPRTPHGRPVRTPSPRPPAGLRLHPASRGPREPHGRLRPSRPRRRRHSQRLLAREHRLPHPVDPLLWQPRRVVRQPR